jgi:hypothetical protein
MSLSLWLFGLLLGMRHALEPDHLAAVSTLVVEQRRVGSGVVLGGMWGLGHTLALLLVATFLAAVGAVMPVWLATAFELGVAVMLMGIGVRSMICAHRHRGHAEPSEGAPRWASARRSLIVGSVHGLAGSGALTALVASRLPSTQGRLFYVALFGLGSVMGMTALSGVAGWPLARLGRSPTVARFLMTGTGVLACGLGIVWGLPLVRELLS